MSVLLLRLRLSVKDMLYRHLRTCCGSGLKTRHLIIVNLAAGRSPRRTANVLALRRGTGYHVAALFRCRRKECRNSSPLAR
jgi:hypothetical protein